MSFFSRLFGKDTETPPVRNVFTFEKLGSLIFSQYKSDLLGVDWSMVSVTPPEVKASSNRSWLPWAAERWDCDDQARALIHDLCLSFYKNTNAPFAPAVGIVDLTRSRTDKHRLVWYADLAGYINLFDPTTGTPPQLSPGYILGQFRCI